MSAILAPFYIPRLKLQLPSLRLPSAMLVFAALFFSYFLVFSGIIYDMINEPPSIGMTREGGGRSRPVAFLENRINGQYIIEGLTAGFFFALGGIGLIMLEKGSELLSNVSSNRYLSLLGGFTFIALSFVLCRVFLRLKIPGY